MAVHAVRDAVSGLENVQSLATPWINGIKVQAARLYRSLNSRAPIGNLHTLLLIHELVRLNSQFD